MILNIIIIAIVSIYLVIFLLNDYNWRCPFGHKWKYWQLIGGVSKTKRRVCTRCKIERGQKKLQGKETYSIKYPKGEYDKFKDFTPIESNIIKRFYLKHINKKTIIINYRGHRIVLKNY